MSIPAPKIDVRAFPLDSKLSFFRLNLTDEERTDLLSLLVERIQDMLTDVTSEVKVNLTQDGGSFILAFLADKQPMTTEAMRELVAQAARRHRHEHDLKE